eukprot:3870310-Rhodomonas_salina.1
MPPHEKPSRASTMAPPAAGRRGGGGGGTGSWKGIVLFFGLLLLVGGAEGKARRAGVRINQLSAVQAANRESLLSLAPTSFFFRRCCRGREGVGASSSRDCVPDEQMQLEGDPSPSSEK